MSGRNRGANIDRTSVSKNIRDDDASDRSMEEGRCIRRNSPRMARMCSEIGRDSNREYSRGRKNRTLRIHRRKWPADVAISGRDCRGDQRGGCSGEPSRWATRRRGVGKRMANTSGELVFAPLGGVGEIGMNLSIYGLG